MTTPQRRLKVLAADATKRLYAYDHENLLFLPGYEDDPGIWHFLVVFPAAEPGERAPSPFAGGAFLFRMDAPANYPASPPKFTSLTPNGVFKPDHSLCISIGMYHPDRWREYKVLGLAGFAANGVFNGLVAHAELGSGIGVIRTTPAMKAAYAAGSWAVCRKKYPDLAAAFVAVALKERNRLAGARTFLQLYARAPDCPGELSRELLAGPPCAAPCAAATAGGAGSGPSGAGPPAPPPTEHPASRALRRIGVWARASRPPAACDAARARRSPKAGAPTTVAPA